MRFLADESCDFAVVRALRKKGYDVVAVSEVAQGASDAEVVQRAVEEDRTLLTEDKDFGELVYAYRVATPGVILIRFPAKARRQMVQTVLSLVESRGEALLGAFVVVEPGAVRLRRPMDFDDQVRQSGEPTDEER